MISHTMSDLLALPTEEERMKARGFVERAGMVIAGGLPGAEMAMPTSAVPLSRAEQDLLVSWQDPPAWDFSTGKEAEPPVNGIAQVRPTRLHVTRILAGHSVYLVETVWAGIQPAVSELAA